MAGEPGGEHAVEQVDAERHRLHHPERVTETHEVPGLVVREERDDGREGLEHGLPRLADRQAADGVAVEARPPGCARRSRPAGEVGAALDDPELVERRVAPARGTRRGRVPPTPPCDRPRIAARRRPTAAVRTRRAPSGCRSRTPSGSSTAELGGEAVGASVVGGAEGDALVVEADVAARLEREDLVAAGVGEHVARPVGEAVQAAERADHVGAGLEHQVVGVAEHDLHAEVGQVLATRGAAPRPWCPPA